MKEHEVSLWRIRRSSFLFLFCLALGTVFSQTAIAQNRNTISGFVFDSQRNPVSQTYVEVTNEVNQVLQRVRTDGSGRYFFTGLSTGRFTLRVLPYGTNLVEQSQDLEIISFPRGGGGWISENAQARDFYLRVRRDAQDERSVTGTIFVQDIPKDAKKYYEKALAEFDTGKTETGIQDLLNALKIYPDYFLVLERLGQEYIKQQQYDFARAVFLKSVSVYERSFNCWYGLSYSAYALKQSDTAVQAAEKATLLEPSSFNAFLMLGISQRQDKKFPQAEKSLLQAKKLAKGSSADVHWNLALLYGNNLSKYKEAADELELYLKVAPSDVKIENVRKLITKFREKTGGSQLRFS